MKRSSIFESLEVRRVLAAPVAIEDSFTLDEDSALGNDQLNAWTEAVQAARPLHWWRFEEGPQPTTTRDYGSTPRDGLIVGLMDFGQPGLVGRAARLEGQGYVRLELPGLPGDWTLESVVGFELQSTDVQGLIGTSSDGTQRGAVSIRPEMLVNQESWGITQFGNPETDYSFGVRPSAGLTYVVMVGTSAGIDLYLDGVHASHVDHVIDLPRYAIGVGHADSYSHAAVELMVGLLDEVVIYDHAFTAIEVASHRKAIQDTISGRAELGTGVLRNDTDADGDFLTALLVNSTAHGAINFFPDGKFTYVPQPDFSGTDSFTYRVSDGALQSPPVTVTLTVRPLPDAPQAVDDRGYVTERGKALTVSAAAGVLANDRDVDGDPLTLILRDPPQHGSLNLRPDGSFTYTPHAGRAGVDVFTYEIRDSSQRSATGRVTLQVRKNSAGGAQDDAYQVAEDGELSIEPVPWLSIEAVPIAAGAMAYDAAGDRLFAAIVPGNGPRSGTLTEIDPYTGALGISLPVPGVVTEIVITDDGTRMYAAVSGARTIQVVDLVSMTLESTISLPGSQVSFGMFTLPGRPDSLLVTTWDIGSRQPAGIVLYENGIALPHSGLGTVVSVDESGQHVYGYDNSSVFWIHEIEPYGLRVIETHAGGSMLGGSFEQFQFARENLYVSGGLGSVVNVANREILTNYAGGWIFRVMSDEDTLYAFDDGAHILYAYDLNPFQERTALQLPNLGAMNHLLKRFGPDGLAMTNDRELTLIRSDEVFGIQQFGVLRNDGPGHANAHPTVVDDVEHGSLQMYPDGTFVYRPEPDYVGLDQFRYRVTDTNGVASTALVTINVTPRNDAPTAVGDEYTMPTVAPLSIDVDSSVLGNDADLDGDALTAIMVDPPQHGTVNLRPDGSFRYLPNATFTVSDSFTYQAHDGSTTSTPQSVTIRLDVPVISVGHYTLRPNTPNQRIELYVTGGHLVSGLDLYALVGDGGPERALLDLPAGEDGPSITSVELKQNTIFASLPDVPTNLQSLPQIANWSIAASGNGSTVVAEGLLATLVIDTTGFFEGDWSLSLVGVLPEHPLGPFQTRFADSLAFVTNGSITVVPTQVLSRQVFYNNSAWDGNDANASSADDQAVATDKRALLPGQTATFANYTSYIHGINGVQLDLLGVPGNITLTAADFTFRMGRSANTATWPEAPVPSVQTRRGAGVNGSDRVSLIWPDDTIRNTWLQVTLKAGERTWLARDEVFYFGNALGETGSTPGNTLVTSIDIIAVRDHQRGPFDLAPIDDPYDFNRDRLVSSIDVILARDHQVGLLIALPLISPSAPTALAARPSALVPGDANGDGAFDSADLLSVFQAGEYEDSIEQNSDWVEGDWNADGDFDSHDLILALQAGYYESQRRTTSSDLAAAVDDLFASGTSGRRRG